jgi:signal transduction histidine kinase
VGITREKIEDPNSFGITGMQERAHLFGGNMTFSGKKGQGTEVTLKIPLEGMWNEFKDLNS